MVPGLFATMRQRPKTSIFLVTTISYSLNWLHDYSLTRDMMRISCKRAAVFGDEKLRSSLSKTRHVTVILNPVAGKRKSKKLYNKWVEPILHLAGIKVSLVETESPNQAYDLMRIMSNCDAVAIVGGDGTVNEAINGLLSRSDSEKAVKEFPIAIIPTGQYNSVARYIHQFIPHRNQKELLIQSTLRLVEQVSQKYDVLKIKPLDDRVRQQEMYALRDIRYGLYQDDIFKLMGYKLYQSYVKPIWQKLQRTFSSKYLKPEIESICYTDPCVGCSKCYEKHRLPDPILVPGESDTNANKRWFGILKPITKANAAKPTPEELNERELAKRDNPQCDNWKRFEIIEPITEFRASMMGEKKVRLSLGKNSERKPSEIIETQDVRLKVASHLDSAKFEADQRQNEADQAAKVTDNNDKEAKEESTKSEDKSVKFLVDGQPKQVQSVEITAIHDALVIYSGDLKLI